MYMTTKKTTKTAPKKTAAKKSVTKAAPKKVAAKKTAPKKSAKQSKKELVYADNERSFWVSDGQVLNSLIALRDALDAMEKEVYGYHAGPVQNDFAIWVEQVLCDADCAKDLGKAKTQKSAKTAVVKHLKFYAV